MEQRELQLAEKIQFCNRQLDILRQNLRLPRFSQRTVVLEIARLQTTRTKAIEELVSPNLDYLYNLAGKMYRQKSPERPELELNDLYSITNQAAVETALSYDPQKGTYKESAGQAAIAAMEQSLAQDSPSALSVAETKGQAICSSLSDAILSLITPLQQALLARQYGLSLSQEFVPMSNLKIACLDPREVKHEVTGTLSALRDKLIP